MKYIHLKSVFYEIKDFISLCYEALILFCFVFILFHAAHISCIFMTLNKFNASVIYQNEVKVCRYMKSMDKFIYVQLDKGFAKTMI